MRCIAKGDEITHIYQGHFGDTRKEERQRILKNMFHFDCLCAACTSNYPLGRNIPKTYEKCSKYIFKSVGAVPYIKDIQQSIEKCDLDLNFEAKFKNSTTLWLKVLQFTVNLFIRNVQKVKSKGQIIIKGNIQVLRQHK